MRKADTKPLRVLYVTSIYKPAYVYGGPARCIPALCEAMARADADVTVFTTNANGSSRLNVPVGRTLDIDGVRVRYFPLARNAFFYSPALASACQEHVSEFEIVTIDSLFGHALGPASRACTSARVPYVVPLHGQLLPWSLRRKRWKKRLYLSLFGRRCLDGAASLHCTDAAEARATSALGLRSPTFTLPHGLDLAHYQELPARGGFRNRLGVPPDSFLLLFLGRLHHKKRPDIAIEVLSACQRLPQDVHLALVGPDDLGLATTLHAQATRLSCLERLHVTGLLEGNNVLQALVDSDLMLMPSEPQSENFGMSALEALAAGVPILVSNGVPLGRSAKNAGAGRMVSCTVEAFTRTTEELLTHPQQLKAMGARGRLLVRQEFDIEIVGQRMITQLQAIVARESGPCTAAPQANRRFVMSGTSREASGVAGEFEEIACTLCGKNETDTIVRGDGLAQIVRCRNDGLIYVNPRPTAEQIEHFSRQYVRQENLEMFVDFRTDILKREAAVIKREKAGGTLLDIGCATGSFFHNFGPDWRLSGVDTSATALDFASAQNGVEVHLGTLRQANFPSGYFDVICMLDTLFLLPDPAAELGEVHRVLKDDGLLAIEIPGINYRRVRDRGMVCWLIDGKWSRMTPEESHLFYFAPTTLRQLLEKTKFQVRGVVPEQASIRGDPVLRKINAIHFWLARSLFFITRGRISIAAKELYLGRKIS